MYHPTRGGARGGAAEFSWDKVKQSKDREFYLGNSVAAPTGRWQDGRDINWYNKDSSTCSATAEEERREELRRIKEAETAALYAKLGRPPPASMGGEGDVKVGEKLASGSAGLARKETTGANSVPLDVRKSRWGEHGEEVSEADKKLARKFARDEVRRRRTEVGKDRQGDDEDERKRRRREENHRHRSSRRRHDEEEINGRRHRHRDRHRAESRRHRDDLSEQEEPKRSHHRRSRSRSRSTSRSRTRSRSISPRPSSHHRHRERPHSHHRHDSDRNRRDRDSPSRQNRTYRDEDFKPSSTSHHGQDSLLERARPTSRRE